MLEQLGAIVGLLFLFSKIVGVVKAILFTERTIKRLTYNDREDYIKGHVFEGHESKLSYCQTNQCASF